MSNGSSRILTHQPSRDMKIEMQDTSPEEVSKSLNHER